MHKAYFILMVLWLAGCDYFVTVDPEVTSANPAPFLGEWERKGDKASDRYAPKLRMTPNGLRLDLLDENTYLEGISCRLIHVPDSDWRALVVRDPMRHAIRDEVAETFPKPHQLFLVQALSRDRVRVYHVAHFGRSYIPHHPDSGSVKELRSTVYGVEHVDPISWFPVLDNALLTAILDEVEDEKAEVMEWVRPEGYEISDEESYLLRLLMTQVKTFEAEKMPFQDVMSHLVGFSRENSPDGIGHSIISEVALESEMLTLRLEDTHLLDVLNRVCAELDVAWSFLPGGKILISKPEADLPDP